MKKKEESKKVKSIPLHLPLVSFAASSVHKWHITLWVSFWLQFHKLPRINAHSRHFPGHTVDSLAESGLKRPTLNGKTLLQASRDESAETRYFFKTHECYTAGAIHTARVEWRLMDSLITWPGWEREEHGECTYPWLCTHVKRARGESWCSWKINRVKIIKRKRTSHTWLIGGLFAPRVAVDWVTAIWDQRGKERERENKHLFDAWVKSASLFLLFSFPFSLVSWLIYCAVCATVKAVLKSFASRLTYSWFDSEIASLLPSSIQLKCL